MDAYIKAISYYLPEGIMSNADLTQMFPDWNAEKIFSKIGIEKRHIAADDETAGDMAVKAATRLFSEHKIDPECIDFILFCTQSPDYYLPATSCVIQNRLGIPTSAGAIDINQGCSGYVYGLSLAKGLIAGEIAKNVLLLTGETYQKYIHPSDKRNKAIFGDAATATLISTDGLGKIKHFVLGTNGSGAKNLIIETGASRHKELMHLNELDENGIIKSSDHLYMNGSEIFNFTLSSVPSLVNETLIRNNVKKDEVDFFVFHQANKFMIDALRKVCGISRNSFYSNLSAVGNTVSNSIPIALQKSLESGDIHNDTKILLAGFGVGYSWGATLLEF